MTRRIHPFNGGIHPDEHKAESNATPIVTLPLLPRYVVPLRQHIGTPARPVVQVGDRVLGGQIIGTAEGLVSVAVHAPTSGVVTAVEARATPHPSGLFDLAVVIDADGDDRSITCPPGDWRQLDPAALRQRVRDLGVAGLGGAVFPSHIKLSPGQGTRIQTLILNGAECEPWITCDDRLMRERAAEVLQGAAIMRHLLGAQQLIVGVEDNKPEAIAALRQAAKDHGIACEIASVPTRYPSGGGKQLVYLLTGMEVPSGKLSTDIGMQVFNVGTAYSLFRALVAGEALTRRIVTVTGHVARPGNFEVRVGTPLSALIAAAGGALPGSSGEIIGGPMMGFDLMDQAAPVTKAVNCVIVKSPALFPPKPAALPCIRCGACARACPVELQPFELYWYSRARDFGRAQSYRLFDCIECGCCSFVCPSQIPLVDYYRFAKGEIWEREREKNAADQARERHEFKTFRQEREKQEKAEKFAKAAEASKARASTEGDEGGKNDAATATAAAEAAKKKAILEAAMARAQQSRESVTPKNTENLSACAEKDIAEIEARRAQATIQTPTPTPMPPPSEQPTPSP